MRLKHRLQNPADLRYFREIVPGIYGQMLDQLPALAPRSALVLGECVQAPALVEIREASLFPKARIQNSSRAGLKTRSSLILKPYVRNGRVSKLSAFSYRSVW